MRHAVSELMLDPMAPVAFNLYFDHPGMSVNIDQFQAVPLSDAKDLEPAATEVAAWDPHPDYPGAGTVLTEADLGDAALFDALIEEHFDWHKKHGADAMRAQIASVLQEAEAAPYLFNFLESTVALTGIMKIREPHNVNFRRQSGTRVLLPNRLFVGQDLTLHPVDTVAPADYEFLQKLAHGEPAGNRTKRTLVVHRDGSKQFQEETVTVPGYKTVTRIKTVDGASAKAAEVIAANRGLVYTAASVLGTIATGGVLLHRKTSN